MASKYKTIWDDLLRVKKLPSKCSGVIEISYEKLLDHFWMCHDPTTLNRQGPDIGRQYRSAIFYYSDIQKNIAKKSIIKHQPKFNNNIVTEITKANTFYLGEDYHQRFIQKRKETA